MTNELTREELTELELVHALDLETSEMHAITPLDIMDKLLAAARREMESRGQIYRHYKGGIYEKLCIAARENFGFRMVVYRDLASGQIWTRPECAFEAKFTPVPPQTPE